MRTLLAALCWATLTQLVAGEDPVYVVHQKSGLCLGVGSDSATLQLLECREREAEQWRLIRATGARAGYTFKNEKYSTCMDSEKSNNGGVVQVFQCEYDSARQHIAFNSDGKIKAGMKCLVAFKDGKEGDMLKFDNDCSDEWATTKNPTRSDHPPSLDSSTPKAPPVKPIPVKPKVESSDSLHSGAKPPLVDHYLCVCLEHTSDDDECVQAVRSACVVGHIPAVDCAASFDNGDHEAVSDAVIRLVKSGAKCMQNTREDVPKSKLIGLKGHSLPKGDDHYLCVCLKNGGAPTDDSCLSAVASACLVGHIPVAACALSFDNGEHSRVMDHVMRMIDNGSNCQATLDYTKLGKIGNAKSSQVNRLSGQDHYLCVCLDDWSSVACKNAVKRGCSLDHLPKEDCNGGYTGSLSSHVTKNVLHLVDHGVACSAHGAMHYTNNRCHCQQSWTSDEGVLMQYPNNCGDPRNVKGFAWCKTYGGEDCKGEGKGWDRCDAPKGPRRDISMRTRGKAGVVTEADHYLCVCIDKDSTDEVCVAAAKAACAVGHLPSDACRESFENSNHEKVSHSIVKIISDAHCSSLDKGNSGSKRTPLASSSAKRAHSKVTGCAHGLEGSNGECSCDSGYAGALCNQCASGYEGYPDCTKETSCAVHCVHGSCDSLTGKCVCPVNRRGKSCDRCAPGLYGKDCLPSGVITSFDTFTTIRRIFFIILVIGAVGVGGWCFYVKPLRFKRRKDYFERVPDMEMSTGKASTEGSQPQNPVFHTGLAI